MPELPEVETVRRQLASVLTGARFVLVETVEPVMLQDCDETQLRKELPNKVITEVGRLGKYLLLRLDENINLTIHLGMTGQLLVSKSSDGSDSPLGVTPLGAPKLEPHKHTRFAFLLEHEGAACRLDFRDARKFGRVCLTVGGPAPRLSNLGPDAWLGEWDADYLAVRLNKRKMPVKAFLLDQQHLSGIGNIYADEILWWTNISPLRSCSDLTAEEIGRLATEIRVQLEEGVKRLGCTFSDFVDTEGKPGTFQEQLKAYGRQGKACSRCGATMEKIVVAGRGTTYCSSCQH